MRRILVATRVRSPGLHGGGRSVRPRGVAACGARWTRCTSERGAVVRRVLPAILPENYADATRPAFQTSRRPHGMITAPQTAAPPQTNGSARPPTTMTTSGTSRPSVAISRPTGPNVVSVFAHRVVRIARSGRAGGATGPCQVEDTVEVTVAAAAATGSKHCAHQVAPTRSEAPQAVHLVTPTRSASRAPR